MTLNEVIMQLVLLSEHPMMPVIFRPAIQKVIETILELEAQPEQRWTPCSEGLPEAKQKVLVQYADGSMTTKRCNDEGHLQWFYANAVAWMPAPEPWEGDTE